MGDAAQVRRRITIDDVDALHVAVQPESLQAMRLVPTCAACGPGRYRGGASAVPMTMPLAVLPLHERACRGSDGVGTGNRRCGRPSEVAERGPCLRKSRCRWQSAPIAGARSCSGASPPDSCEHS